MWVHKTCGISNAHNISHEKSVHTHRRCTSIVHMYDIRPNSLSPSLSLSILCEKLRIFRMKNRSSKYVKIAVDGLHLAASRAGEGSSACSPVI